MKRLETSILIARQHAFLILLLFILVGELQAADRYWVATGSGVWSDVSNWSTTSGGPGGALTPTSVDRVIFNANGLGDCTVDIPVTCEAMLTTGYTSTLDLNGNPVVLSGAVSSIFDDIRVIDGLSIQSISITTSLSVTLDDIVMEVPLQITAQSILFHGGVYHNPVTVVKNGSASSRGDGGCTFLSTLEMSNEDTGWFLMGYVSGDVFMDEVVFNNSSTSRIRLAYNTGVTEFHGNIRLSNTGGGIWFGEGGGTSQLSPGQSLLVDPSDFTIGELRLMRFEQQGSSPQSIELSGTAILRLQTGTQFEGALDVISPRIYTNDAHYLGAINFQKTGAGSDMSIGGNVFNSATVMRNSGSGYLGMGNGNSDLFESDLTLINDGAHHIYLAYNSAENRVLGDFTTQNLGSAIASIYVSHLLESSLEVDGNAEVLNAGNGTSNTITLGYHGAINIGGDLMLTQSGTSDNSNIIVSSRVGAEVRVLGNCSISNNGSNNSKIIYLGNQGDVSVQGPTQFENHSTATNSQIYIAFNVNSQVYFGDDITLEVDEPLSRGVFFGHAAGQTTLASGATFDVPIYLAGRLNLHNITALGVDNQSFETTGTTIVSMSNCSWNSNISIVSPRIYFNHNRVGGDVEILKTGSINDYSSGGNQVLGDMSYTADGSGYLLTGGVVPDSVHGNLLLHSRGTQLLYWAYSTQGNYVGGSLEAVISEEGEGLHIAASSISDLEVMGNVSVRNSSNSSNASRIYLGGAGDVLIQGDLEALNQTAVASGSIHVANSADSEVQVMGEAVVTNAGLVANSTIYFPHQGQITAQGNIEVTNSGDNVKGQILIANGAGSRCEMKGNLHVLNQGAGSHKRVYVGNLGSIDLTGEFTVRNESNAIHSFVFVAASATASAHLRGDIHLSQIHPDGDGVYFGAGYGDVTLSPGVTFDTPDGFIAGTLGLRSIKALGTDNQSFNLTGTAYLYVDSSSWGGNFSGVSPRVVFENTFVPNDLVLQKTGGQNDYSRGGNKILGNARWEHHGSNNFLHGNLNPDSIFGGLELTTSGPDARMYFAHNSTGNFIGGDIDAQLIDDAYYLTFANSAISTIDVAGDVNILSAKTEAANSYAYLGNNGQITIGGNLRTENRSQQNTNHIYIANGLSSTVSVQGDTYVENNCPIGISYTAIGNAGDVTINGSLHILNQGLCSSSNIVVASGVDSEVEVIGACSIENVAALTSGRVIVASSGKVDIGGVLSLVNSSSALNSNIHLALSANAELDLHQDVLLTVNVPECDGIQFGGSNGKTRLHPGVELRVVGSYIAGSLLLRHVETLAADDQSLTLTGTAVLRSSYSTWKGEMYFESPRVYTDWSSYGQDATFVKTGMHNDASPGGNTIAGEFIWANEGTGYLLTGNQYADTIVGNATLLASGNGARVYIAYNSPGTLVHGDVLATVIDGGIGCLLAKGVNSSLEVRGNTTLNNYAVEGPNSDMHLGGSGDLWIHGNVYLNNAPDCTNGQIYMAHSVEGNSIFDGDIFIKNDKAGNLKRVWIATQGSTTFNGIVRIDNRSTASHSQVLIGYGNSADVTFEEDVFLDRSVSGCDGILFGTGTGQLHLSDGKRIIADTPQIVDGTILLRNIHQHGLTSQNFVLGGNSTLHSFNSIWEAPFNGSSSRVYSNYSTYLAPSHFHKFGGGSDAWTGDNEYFDDVTFTNTGTGYLMPSNGQSSTYHEDVRYEQYGTGLMYDAYNCVNSYAGDITFDCVQPARIGAATGVMKINGASAQSMSIETGTSEPILRRLQVDKLGDALTITCNPRVTTSLDLMSGLVHTTPAELITMTDNALILNVSDESHVTGPLRKTGNDAFTYPVGSGAYYRPIAMSAPSSGSASFEACYFPVDPNPLYDRSLKDSEIEEVSDCEYWTLNRLATTNAVEVMLSYNPATSCVIDSDIDSLAVCRWDGALWDYHGGQNYSGDISGASVWSEDAVTSFSPFTLGRRRFQTPLPIELLSFSAMVQGDEVLLQWLTASEVNNDYFTLERSDDLVEWQHVTDVPGAGNSSEELSYETIDHSPFNGRSYYRLRQTDFDGAYEEFAPVTVYLGQAANSPAGLMIYPNPSTEVINVELEPGTSGTVEIYTMSGELIQSEKISETSSQTLQLGVQELPVGVYLLRLSSRMGVQQTRFIKE